jgi:competence protein ComEC
VIPLSTLVLLGGIFLLVVSFIPTVASLVGVVLEWMIKALNWIVFKTESLPLSLINNIHLTILQCWLLMGILISLTLLFQWKSLKWLYTSFAMTIAFVAIQWIHFNDDVNQKQMVVYSINNHQAIEFIDKGKSFFISDSSLANDQERIHFHIAPNRLNRGVSSIESNSPFTSEDNGLKFFHWQNEIFVLLEERKPLPVNSNLDYLIVSKNSLQANQLSKLKVKQIVFDGSNSRRYVEKISTIALNNHIQVHSVFKEGAFIIQ